MNMLRKRKISIIILGLIFALSTLLFAGSVSVARASDAVSGTGITAFSMVDGASIRIVQSSSNQSGIRFMAKLDTNTKDYVVNNDGVNMGFIITPWYFFENRTGNEYVTDIERYVGKYDADGETLKGGVIVNESTFYQEGTDGAWYVNGVVRGLKEENLDLQYTAIAYIYDGETYTYAVAEQDLSRSYKQIASKAYLSGDYELEDIKTDADWLSDFGGAANPVQIFDKADVQNLSYGLSAREGYENVNFKVQKNIDLGAGDGSDVSGLLNGFAGTVTAADGATVEYVSNNGEIAISDDATVMDGIYKCTLGETFTTKVMSFNIRMTTSDDTGNTNWSARNPYVIDYIYNQDASVICLQEVDFSQFQLIKEQLNQKDQNKWTAIWHYRTVEEKNSQGLAILYDNTVYNKHTDTVFWLSDTPDERGSKYSGTSYPRIAVNALLEEKNTGAKLNVFNVHLENGSDTASIAARTNGIQIVLARAAEAGYPFVITGDFNDTNVSECYDAIAAVAQDSQAKATVTQSGATYNGWGAANSTRAIDFCFVSDGIRPLTFDILDQDKWNITEEDGSVSNNLYSDHFGIKTEMRIVYDAASTVPSDSSAFVKTISSAEEYAAFVETVDKNTYAGIEIRFTESLTLDEFKGMPHAFAGEFTAADGVKITAPIGVGNMHWRNRDTNTLLYNTVVNTADLSITGDYTGAQADSFTLAAARVGQLDINLNLFDLSDKNYLSFWVATDAPTEIQEGGYIQYSDGGGTVLGETKLTALEQTGVWKNYLIPVSTVLEHYETYGYIRLFKLSYYNVTGRGSVYVGGIDFVKIIEEQIPDLSLDIVNFYATDGTTLASGKLIDTPTTIGGDYAGAKVISKGVGMNVVRLNINPNFYNLENYNYLSIWLATDTPTAITGFIQYSDGSGVIGEQKLTTLEETGVWKQFLVPIATVLESYETYGYIRLMRTSYSGVTNRGNIYVGDVKFVKVLSKQLPELSTDLVKVYTSTFEYYTNGMMVDASTLAFSGGYTGTNAVRTSCFQARFIGINANVSDYDLSGYTHLSVWIAVAANGVTTHGAVQLSSSTGILAKAEYSSDISNYLTLESGTLKIKESTTDADGNTVSGLDRWMQFFIPIEYVVNSTSGDVNAIKFMRLTSPKPTGMTDSNYLYIGDLQFVTLPDTATE